MKYMLLMNTPRDGYTQYFSWPKKILEANMAFMGAMAQKLAASGELVGTEGLASPLQAKLVRAGPGGKPIEHFWIEVRQVMSSVDDLK